MTIILVIALIAILINTILLVVLFLQNARQSTTNLKNQLDQLEKGQERGERIFQEAISKNREEFSHSLNSFNESLIKQLASLTQLNEDKLEKLREVVHTQLKSLQDDNNQKLEKMRETVDEKLHSTLEKRLGESFQVVSDRLEKVHQGLGEMQTLASGVGDLKKVLLNVKTRGILGEVQLGNILEQMLTPEQYDRNVVTKKGSRDAVEFAIKLPGKDKDIVYLPIDSKFPVEDYERLQIAQDQVNIAAIDEASKALESRLKLEAKKIREKYLDPPFTTDFAILFLPTEGLYAEVLRRPGLLETLQREHKITVAGPTTIAAILNSFQMGFRTLAVEKRASEVWTLLGVVKTEFGKFGDILKKTQDKIRQAGDTLEEASQKTRTIERKLKDVQELPSASRNQTSEKAEELFYQE
jgi:DNA recombination protein RmuC